MAGGEGLGAPGLPHPQEVLAEIAVDLVGKGHAERGVWDELAECPHHLLILLMHLGGG